jgi:hypothetical protein
MYLRHHKTNPQIYTQVNASWRTTVLLTASAHRSKGARGCGACVPLREGPFGGDGDLGLLAGDGDGVAEVPGLAAGDLDALLQELLERGDVHDLVLHGLGAVDHERDRPLLLRRRRRAARHLFFRGFGSYI